MYISPHFLATFVNYYSLIDVSVCVTSNYNILKEPNNPGGLYTRAFQIDDSGGKQQLIDLAADVSSNSGCSACSGNGDLRRGFRAEVQGVVTALADGEIPPTLQVVQVQHSNGLATV